MTEETTAMVPVGASQRQDFNGTEMVRAADVGASALQTAAQAEVQARYIVAHRNPRNALDARTTMLNECRRPEFAGMAIYRKPIGSGKSAEGMSIRFAEAAARAWTNIHIDKTILHDDDQKRILRVSATDLESNLSESVDVIVEKTVERKQLRDGQKPIRSRVNSYGELVYVVPADEGALLTKQKAEVAKAKREVVLGLIPGDLLEECRREVKATQERGDREDPKGALKKLCDGFAGIGVRASDLEEYLGHSIDGASPAEIAELRGAYVVVRDGEGTWPEVVQAKTGGSTSDPKVAALRDKIASSATNGKNRGNRG